MTTGTEEVQMVRKISPCAKTGEKFLWTRRKEFDPLSKFRSPFRRWGCKISPHICLAPKYEKRFSHLLRDYCSSICAEHGWDGNIRGEELTQQTNAKYNDLITETMDPPGRFRMAADTKEGLPGDLVWYQAFPVTTEVDIRHGTAVTISELCWLVSTQMVPKPLLAPPLFKPLGLKTGDIISDAADQFSGSFDADQPPKLHTQHGESRI